MTALQTLRIAIALSFAPPTLASFPAQPATATPAVTYVVSIPQPHTHIFAVEMQISGAVGDNLDVSMPVWTPGSYLVREYERHVVDFAASDTTGKPLPWYKLDKNTWRIAADGAANIVIEYEVYAREPGIRWSFVNDMGGHILGPSLFMHVVGATDRPTSVTFDLPAGWRIDGGIAATGTNPYTVSARSYHELIDTPMLIGNFVSTTFDVDGITHLIAILGPNNADLERLRDQFAKIVTVCSELFGGVTIRQVRLRLHHADGRRWDRARERHDHRSRPATTTPAFCIAPD